MRIEQNIERKFSVAVIGDQRVTGHIGGEKLLRSGSNPAGDVKNCFGTAQIPLGKQEFAMGTLKFNYEGKKLLRGGSNPVGEVKNCFGAAQIPSGRADECCGKRQMRISEIDEPMYQLSSLQGDKERTMTIEQESNRNPDRFSLGATEMFGVPLLTIKYDNPASERIAETAKKAHLSASKTGGERNNKSRLTTNKIDTEKNRPEVQSSWLMARGLQPKNDECRLTIEDFRSDLTSGIRIETEDITEITNKLVACSSRLTAKNINPYFLVLPGKRTVANKLIKQSCAYET